jgi:hypothetical protein
MLENPGNDKEPTEPRPPVRDLEQMAREARGSDLHSRILQAVSVLIVAVLVIAAILGLGGCSIYQSPTPKADARIVRQSPIVKGDGSQQMQLADSVSLPEQWSTGSLEFLTEKTYTVTETGATAISGERTLIRRFSDAGPAGEVAVQRGAQAAQSIDIIGAVVKGAVEGAISIQGQKIEADKTVSLAEINAGLQRRIAELEAERIGAIHSPEPPATPAPPASE